MYALTQRRGSLSIPLISPVMEVSESEKITLPLPDRCFVSIEYPGDIQNIAKAIQTLGGEKRILQACKDPEGCLELRFNPNALHKHPLTGLRKTTSNILMKVLLKSTTLPSGQLINKTVAKLYGKISTTYAFEGMADFQYESLGTEHTYESSCRDFRDAVDLSFFANPPVPSIDSQLRIVPPIFSKDGTPQDYSFKNAATFLREDDEDMSLMVVGVEQATYPTAPVRPAAMAMLTDKEKTLLGALQEIFKERPMWVRLSLVNRLNDSTVSWLELKKVIPLVAFLINQGPWLKVYTAFGYDPRSNPASHQYQILSIRADGFLVFPKEVASVYSKHAIPSHSKPKSSVPLDKAKNRFDSEVAPKITYSAGLKEVRSSYQICELQDKTLLSIISSRPLRSKVHVKDGWFEAGVLDLLRSEIKEQLGIARGAPIIPKEPVAVRQRAPVKRSSTSKSTVVQSASSPDAYTEETEDIPMEGILMDTPEHCHTTVTIDPSHMRLPDFDMDMNLDNIYGEEENDVDLDDLMTE